MTALRVTTFLIAIALTCHSAPAHAQTTAETADSLLRDGVELRRQGRDAEALQRFERAYNVDHSPIAMAQWGLAEQALGHWVDSERHVREALATTGNPWIEQNRRAITNAYETIRQHVGSIDVSGGVPGAEVTLNGRPLGRLPMQEPASFVTGPAYLEVRANGYEPFHAEVTIEPAQTLRQAVRLVPRVQVQSAGLAWQQQLAIAAGALAVAGLVTGIVGIAMHEDAVAAYNADANCPGTNASTQPGVCQERIDRGNGGVALEAVGFVGVGVFGAAATALWLYSRSNPPVDHTRRAALSWQCGIDGVAIGVTCFVRY